MDYLRFLDTFSTVCYSEIIFPFLGGNHRKQSKITYVTYIMYSQPGGQ